MRGEGRVAIMGSLRARGGRCKMKWVWMNVDEGLGR